MKKVTVDGYFVSNLGDDLFLKALFERFPNQIFYVYLEPEQMNHYAQMGGRVIPKRNNLFKKLGNCMPIPLVAGLNNLIGQKNDLYLLLGGSMFIEGEYSHKQFRQRLFEVMTSRKKFVLGSNFGPFYTAAYLAQYTKWFGRLTEVTWRDQKSADYFANTMIHQRVLPDLVMSMDTSQYDIKHDYALVNVMALADSGLSEDAVVAYRDGIVAEIKRLRDKGQLVHLLSLNAFDGDDDALATVKNAFNDDDSVVSVYYDTVDQVLQEFAGASQVLATRYHAMVLSWMFGKPVHALAYSKKTVNYIERWFKNQPYTDLTERTFNTDLVYEMMPAAVRDELHTLAGEHFDGVRQALMD
ncbi:polysaccharide pyruvyl transferase family protein [Weissella confusa]|uniref:polysaccharide pyruvyl transferase family protein n=1 Tax=Weissella confusa TaxID=1583 RepID=UPI002E20D74C|nr:polysaccharide pyruvyl transferase family protein [Weissella confusa]